MSSRPSVRVLSLRTLATAATAAVVLAMAPGAASADTLRATGAGHCSASSTTHTTTSRAIVKLAAAPAPADVVAAVTRQVQACGGTVLSVQHSVGTIVADVPPAAAAQIGLVPGVLSVSPDRTATPMSLGFDPSTQPGSMTNVTRSTGAQYLWKQGLTGAGVDVALIDTGVAPVPALSDPAKVVLGPDLSFESQDPNLRYLDTFGHGTHMGSIIAGREVPRSTGAAYAADTKNFYGMAPDSRLVSVKVGSHDGAVDVSQLIAAIDWVVQNRFTGGLNIKVLNLSFGTDSTQSWKSDPLAQAAEVATRAGILVVAAGGNDGEKARGLADPAYDPYVMAVGAADTKGTDTSSDDTVPSFSQHSDAALAERQPDVVAPGVKIVAPAVPGSTLAQTYPNALVGGGAYIRGSGTSQAAAVMSGAAALIWQKWPFAAPLQIRQLLIDNTSDLAGTTRAYAGSGEVNLTSGTTQLGMITAKIAYDLSHHPDGISLGNGTLQGARGSQSVSIDGVPLTGEQDIFGKPWSAVGVSGLTAGFVAWATCLGQFNNSIWIGTGFTPDSATIAGQTWSGRSWSGRSWAGNAWSGRSWAGRSWAGRSWAGGAWTGGSWGDPVTLSDGKWTSRTWASTLWE